MLSGMARWVAGAHPEPARVWEQWAELRAALVPAGRRWDAVRMPVTLLQRVVEETQVLTEAPIVADLRSGECYVLVPAGAGVMVAAGAREVTALGVGSWVAMADPGAARVWGARVGVWLQLPSGVLADPGELGRALAQTGVGRVPVVAGETR
ncbi:MULTISPECIES: hypothetical protein [unclassified Streptomyces]|uniref:hypothetical protein n=1 Tax=unclassified Streptomyces TaxID=2593676 RepID=UPI0036522AC8